MVLIAPSILSADFGNLRQDVELLEKSGADWLHIDIMDGHFVPNLTFGPQLVSALRPCSKLVFDTHLMVDNPLEVIPWFAEAGSDIITIHFEACDDARQCIELIHSYHKKAGISICPQTPVQVLKPLLNEVDLILVMTVMPGFGGQKFQDSQLTKIAEVSHLTNHIFLEVDGGINPQTGRACQQAGANVLVAGSSIFKTPDYAGNITALKE